MKCALLARGIAFWFENTRRNRAFALGIGIGFVRDGDLDRLSGWLQCSFCLG